MKSFLKVSLSAVLTGGLLATGFQAQAGNPERAGQAGATQLLINPYARSAGWAAANGAFSRGLESQYTNVAGIAYTKRTEVMFMRSAWLVGTGININAFGVSQRVGETGAIGLGITSINAGKIERTTEDQPEGGLGTFTPRFTNIALSYAKCFSDNIYGGITVRAISEGIDNVKAQGVSIDAGVQYHTGKQEQMHLGVALKNIGPKMQYKGDGLSTQGTVTNAYGNEYQLTLNNRSGAFELPALLNISLGYDLYFLKDTAGKADKTHRVTVAGNYTSNSFTKDNYMFGLEYGWRNIVMVRGGLTVEKGIFKGEGNRTTAFTGPSCGATVEIPFTEKKSTVAVDYSYRFTNPFGGVHTFGLRVNL
ncbi:MAG: PorV/PorQ family protein [Bacteroidia bacterium]|nr:PorV/PorQ family protein [Bacteroidia bacterium]